MVLDFIPSKFAIHNLYVDVCAIRIFIHVYVFTKSECAYQLIFKSRLRCIPGARTHEREKLCVWAFVSILILLSLSSWIVRRHAFNIYLVICARRVYVYVCIYAIIDGIHVWKSTLVCVTCIKMLEHQQTTLWALPKCKQVKVPTLHTTSDASNIL